jgi:HTH-type transcriptional regulator/antitoxin HigA
MSEHVAAFAPRWASPPGETIRAALGERGITVEALAGALGRPQGWVHRLLEGNESISIETARRLAATLGGSVEFWMTRDSQFHDDRSRVAADQWAMSLPISEMTSLGWIERPRNWQERIKVGLRFFGVRDLDAWNDKYKSLSSDVLFRASESSLDLKAVASWLRKAELDAQGIHCQPWNAERFRAVLPDIRALTRKRDPQTFIPKLTSLCADAGVVLTVVRAPRGCRISGAARFVSEDRAQIVLSARYLADDHLWFTFFHEAGHLIKHDGQKLFVDQIERGEAIPSSPAEKEADEFAGLLLVPEASRQMLEDIKRPRARDIAMVARSAGVAPGIIVGYLQHEGTLGFATKLNGFKHRYKWAGSTLERA